MGRRLTRREIKKKDPVTETLMEVWTYLIENKKLFFTVLMVAIGLMVIYIIGENMYSKSLSAKAQTWKKAMDAVTARIDPAQKTPSDDVFPDNKSKYTAALALFKQVSEEAGNSLQGKTARYYQAICLRELGQLAEAEKMLADLAVVLDESSLRQFCQVARAEVLRLQKKFGPAIQLYQEIEKTGQLALPPAALAVAKADCLKESGQKKEAYEQLKAAKRQLQESQEPQINNPYSTEIDNRIELLKAELALQGVNVS